MVRARTVARAVAHARARVSPVPSPLYILAEVAQKLTSKLPGDGGRKKVPEETPAQRETCSKTIFRKRYGGTQTSGNGKIKAKLKIFSVLRALRNFSQTTFSVWVSFSPTPEHKRLPY